MTHSCKQKYQRGAAQLRVSTQRGRRCAPAGVCSLLPFVAGSGAPIHVGVTIASALVALVCLCVLVRRIAARQFELQRFSGARGHWWEFLVQDVKRYGQYRASAKTLSAMRTSISERDSQLLAGAGMVTEQSRARFFLVREVLLGSALVVAVTLQLACSSLVAALLMVPVVVVAVWGPRAWLLLKRQQWRHTLRLEQVLLIETLCSFSRSRRNPVEVLERYADLVHAGSGGGLDYGLGRVRWSVRTGGTAPRALAAAATLPSYDGQLRQLEQAALALELPPAECEQQLLNAAREARAELMKGLMRRSKVGARALIGIALACAVLYWRVPLGL